jgi:hypothetical protein
LYHSLSISRISAGRAINSLWRGTRPRKRIADCKFRGTRQMRAFAEWLSHFRESISDICLCGLCQSLSQRGGNEGRAEHHEYPRQMSQSFLLSAASTLFCTDRPGRIFRLSPPPASASPPYLSRAASKRFSPKLPFGARYKLVGKEHYFFSLTASGSAPGQSPPPIWARVISASLQRPSASR